MGWNWDRQSGKTFWIEDNNRQHREAVLQHNRTAELAYTLWEIYGTDADTNWYAAQKVLHQRGEQ